MDIYRKDSDKDLLSLKSFNLVAKIWMNLI